MKENLYYFHFSKSHKEDNLDPFYCFFDKDKDLELYKSNAKEIKKILITIKTLSEKGKDIKVIDSLYSDLMNSLNDYSNTSEFGCFINACDSVLSTAKNDLSLLKKICKKYFENRDLNEFVPEEWIQAIIDTNSSRKKGKAGENKISKILNSFNYKKVLTLEEFKINNKCFTVFGKGTFDIKNVRSSFGAKIATKKQNKNLDFIIKNNNKIFFLEAKHLNTSGGGQDKQIAELIELISLHAYIGYLDGVYSNTILNENNTGDKLRTQQKEIQKALEKNKNNLWVNTAGFKELLQDLH